MSETSPSSNGPPAATAPGLPTVEPPSGRHILQMFIVPGVIVAAIVIVLLVFMWLFGGPHTPEQFLKKLDDPNPEVRWRTASDLAQVLLRDQEMSSNADFALGLAQRLDNAIRASEPAEKALAERLDKIKDKAALAEEWKKIRGEEQWKKLEAERNYIMYLGACLGNFTVPAGVPLLKQMAEQTDGMEPRGLAARRWRAVFALANLGQKLDKDYPALPDLRKDLIEQQLTKAAERKDLAPWAGPALEHIKNRRAGRPDLMGLTGTFKKCVGLDPKWQPKQDPRQDFGTSDPFLRELVALALNFWTGTDAENREMDGLLGVLRYDTGAGADLLGELADENPDGFRPSTNVTGREVAYNAVIALANRGSDKVKDNFDMLQEMLTEDDVRKHLKVRAKDGTERTDDAAAVQTLINALKAVGQLHRKQPDMDLSSVRPAIDKLADNSNKAVQTEARNVQKTLGAK
jgi:hypothetical protein